MPRPCCPLARSWCRADRPMARSATPLELAGELYDPSTGTWTTTGSLTGPRSLHEAILLPSGKVLVIGGLEHALGMTSNALASCELYDPDSGAWTVTGAMSNVR